MFQFLKRKKYLDVVLSSWRCEGLKPNDKDNALFRKALLKNFPDFTHRIYEYDKSKFGKWGIKLPNHGREQHTFAYHMAKHYSRLGHSVVCIASSTKDHPERIRFVRTMNPDVDTAFLRRTSTYERKKTKTRHGMPFPSEVHKDLLRLSDLEDFRHAFYVKTQQKLVLADPRPLRKWAEHHIGYWEGSLPASSCGLFKTTKEHIRKMPVEVYENIEEQGQVANHSEFAHYMERLAGLVYCNPENKERIRHEIKNRKEQRRE